VVAVELLALGNPVAGLDTVVLAGVFPNFARGRLRKVLPVVLDTVESYNLQMSWHLPE
jgi:hypothetical protein